MSSPIDPSKNTPPPSQPARPQPSQPVGNIDPTGTWSKFLSTPSAVATPEEVKMFMQGMLKMFNVIIQQQDAAYKRANEKLKKAEEGEE